MLETSSSLTAPSASPPARVSGRAYLPLALVALLVAAAGWYGLSADRGGSAPAPVRPAATGTPVEIPGGTMVVDRVSRGGVDMSMPMSGQGMSMAMPNGAGMDKVPAGKHRIIVDVTVAAEAAADLAVVPARYRVVAAGIAPVAPHRVELGDREVPAGSMISGTMVFDVPEDARGLRLAVAGGERPVALPVAHGGGHSH